MGDGPNGKDLGIRQIGPNAGSGTRVNLRIPPIPGVPPQILVQMVQGTMQALHPYAPLRPLQELADAACAIVGDQVAIEQITQALLEAPPAARWRLEIVRPLQVQVGDDNLAELELVLEAPCRLSDCRTPNDLASFSTMIGYLTSPVMRGLLRLEGRRARLVPPFLPEPETTD